MTTPSFPVVAIGASAGGIDAFHCFFDHMPADCGMAFVMILHLPADHKSMLTEILSRWTTMPVLEVSDLLSIEPNSVYVLPPHTLVTLSDDRVRIRAKSVEREAVFRPIDAFFDSLGAATGERAVGIVLSGTGSDGALGLKAIKVLRRPDDRSGARRYRPAVSRNARWRDRDRRGRPGCSVEEMPAHLLRLRASPAPQAVGNLQPDDVETAPAGNLFSPARRCRARLQRVSQANVFGGSSAGCRW